ncbi:hypothetical protein VPNG_04937 [Cytospora leucostoma]|uniref:Uncharacterized protein n=1 Tax=Cytospora leucostoma TaxID=1230097 RepID=A0A423X767_9PEZI|nr:hypothetical protein VPNG_04937 [Cytospora leucostoma]
MDPFNPSQDDQMDYDYEAYDVDTGASQASDQPQDHTVDTHQQQGQRPSSIASYHPPQLSMMDPRIPSSRHNFNAQDHSVGYDGHHGHHGYSTSFEAQQVLSQGRRQHMVGTSQGQAQNQIPTAYSGYYQFQQPMVPLPLHQGSWHNSIAPAPLLGSNDHQGHSTGFVASQTSNGSQYHTQKQQGQWLTVTENTGPPPNESIGFPNNSFPPDNTNSIAAFAQNTAVNSFGGQPYSPLPIANMANNADLDSSTPPPAAPVQDAQPPAPQGPQAGAPSAPAAQAATFSFEIRGSADRHPYTVQLSRPARFEDLALIDPDDRAYIHENTKTNEKQKGNPQLKKWYKEICPAYWSDIISTCASDIPPSMVGDVHKQLCASKFGIKDPWSGHALFKKVWNSSRKDNNQGYNILRLKAWMYGDEETTHQTWRETLRSKGDEKDRVVPWVPREVILAVWVLMKEGKAQDPTSHSMVKKREELQACKLMYLVSNQESVQADPYWQGFEDELALDPQQKHLYAKTIADKDAYIAMLEGLLEANGIAFPRRQDA